MIHKIEIKEDITRKVAKRVIRMLHSNPKRDFLIEIDSDGGSYWDAVDVFNAMRGHAGKITTSVRGIAASSASLIFLGGKERHVEQGSNVMMHQPWTPTGGNAKELRAAAGMLENVSKHAIELYSKFTKKSKKYIETLLDAETYLTGPEALELGFATSVVQSESKVMAYAKRRLKVVMKTQKKAVAMKNKNDKNKSKGKAQAKKSSKKTPVKMQLSPEIEAMITDAVLKAVTAAIEALEGSGDEMTPENLEVVNKLVKKQVAKVAGSTDKKVKKAEIKMKLKTIDNVVGQMIDLEKEPLTKAARKDAYVLMQKGKFDKKAFLKTAKRVKAKMKLDGKGKVDHNAVFSKLTGGEKTEYYNKYEKELNA